MLPASALRGERRYELGEVDGVPLTFSDLAPAPSGGLVFCAVAEDSASTYLDGPCVGAAVGFIDPVGKAKPRLQALPEPNKIEGISVVAADGDELTVLLVADADDPAVPAPLLEGTTRGLAT